jgi:long-chain acyl-CoA synthetase
VPPRTPTSRPSGGTAATRRKTAEPRAAATPAPAPSPYDDRPWLTSYPKGVPAELEIPGIPVTRLLDDAAAAFPTRAAITFLGTVTTYRELRDQVDRCAAGLARLGVTKGDRVALVLPNCPQFVVTFYAALRLGAVVAPLNPLGTPPELERQLNDCGARVVVCLDKTFASVDAVRARTPVEHVVVGSVIDYFPALHRTLMRLPLPQVRQRRDRLTARLPRGADAIPFLDALRPGGGRLPEVEFDADDVAALLYTGGTTGISRGAMLSHRNLVANAQQSRLWYADAQLGREVTLGVLPLFHAYGLTLCLTCTTLLAGTLVLLPRFDLDMVLSAIDEHRPTLFPGVPPIYRALVDSPKARRHDLRSIRACISGSMRLPPETQEQFEKVTGARLVEGFGMTETSPVTHANPMRGLRKPGSIGVPVSGTLCQLVDPDDPDRIVPLGEAGELAVSGPQVFRGYWGDSDSSALFTGDGYLLTGDVAVMDDDGFFTLVDRKKELIVAGGFNIYPSEIEDVLREHPDIDDACVIGIPDRYRGETVKAFVVLKPSAELSVGDVVDYCASQLTAYKVPKQVEFRDLLPQSDVGKVLRRTLRDEELAKQGKQL